MLSADANVSTGPSRTADGREAFRCNQKLSRAFQILDDLGKVKRQHEKDAKSWESRSPVERK